MREGINPSPTQDMHEPQGRALCPPGYLAYHEAHAAAADCKPLLREGVNPSPTQAVRDPFRRVKRAKRAKRAMGQTGNGLNGPNGKRAKRETG